MSAVPAVLPPSTSPRVVLKRGMVGHEVYVLQVLLNDLTTGKAKLGEDGHFGAKTESKVRGLQKTERITQDGIAGLDTQRRLALRALKKAEAVAKLPTGLLRGIMENESGYVVGSANWSVPGGVDVALMQERVYTADYGDAARWREAMGLGGVIDAARTLREAYDRLHGLPGATTAKRAWELAALNHNYPYGADQIARGHGLSTAPKAWVQAIRVPGVDSPAEWAEFYIGKVTPYVKDWTV